MDPSTAVNAAASTIIASWGVPGAIIVILGAAVGVLLWLLIRNYNGQLATMRSDLEAKYADAAAGRDVLRELKTSIDMNTRAMDTAVVFLKGKV